MHTSLFTDTHRAFVRTVNQIHWDTSLLGLLKQICTAKPTLYWVKVCDVTGCVWLKEKKQRKKGTRNKFVFFYLTVLFLMISRKSRYTDFMHVNPLRLMFVHLMIFRCSATAHASWLWQDTISEDVKAESRQGPTNFAIHPCIHFLSPKQKQA